MTTAQVELRAFPFPFRAMLAINSDIDRTSPLRFREIHQFLNTKEETPLGPGLGLDVADSMWFYRPRLGKLDPISAELSYFHGNDWKIVSPYTDELLHYVRSGWIDTIHGYGNFDHRRDPDGRWGPFSRRHAEVALSVLRDAGLTIPVWSNHGNWENTQNIGHAAHMQGDDPESPYYHADLLRDAGVIFHWGHGAATEPGARTKLRAYELKDGSSCWQFTRFSSRPFEDAERDGLPGWQVSQEKTRRAAPMLWLPRWLHIQLAESVLQDLVDHQYFSIVAQHLGTARPMLVFGGPATDRLRRLAELHETGQVLVARTSRLLAYNRARDHVRYRILRSPGDDAIDVISIEDPVLGTFTPQEDDLRGVTFRVPEPGQVRLLVAGREVEPELVQRNPSDGISPSIGFAWFRPDYQDHSAPFSEGLRVLTGDRERAHVEAACKAALRAVTDGKPPRGMLPRTFETAAGAARRIFQQPLGDLVTKLRSIGFMEREALHLGSGVGNWCLALAEAGVSRVIGVDPRPAFVAVAEIAVNATATADQIEFLCSDENNTTLEEQGFDFVVWRRSPGFTSPERSIDYATRALRRNGAMYAAYTGTGGFLRALDRALDSEDGEWRVPVQKLVAAQLYRNGLFVGADGGAVPTVDELLSIADSRGLTFVEQPRIFATPPVHLGMPVTIEALFQRERSISAGKELTEMAVDDPNFARRAAELIEQGAPGLVANVLAERSHAVKQHPELGRLLLRAAAKAGSADDRHLDDVLDREKDPVVRGLVMHARGMTQDAAFWYSSADPTPSLLVGSTLLEMGQVDAAESLLEDAAERDGEDRLDSAVGLLAAAARRGDRDIARERYEQVVAAFANDASHSDEDNAEGSGSQHQR